MRINQVTKYIRGGFRNKADEGSDLGGSIDIFAGGDANWDMSNTMFIDDTQDLTNLGSEDLIQPDLNSVDFEDTDTELGGGETESDEDEDPDEEQEESDEKPDEEQEESDEELDEELDEETDADSEVDESDDDDADTGDSDTDSDDADSVEEAKKDDSKYVNEIKRLRTRAQSAESKLNKLNAAIQNGGDESSKNQLAALQKELDAEDDAYEEALMDGDKETARKHRTKRNEIQQKITSISAGSLSTLQGELSGAQAEVSAMINEALSHVYKRYPQLDASDSSANPQMINIINNMATQKRKDGSGVFDALMDAIDEGVLLLQLKPKGEVTEDKTKQKKVAEKRNKKATERRIDAVKKPKRKANSPRKPSTRINPKEVHKMSEADFSSKEGRQALNQEFGIRFDA